MRSAFIVNLAIICMAVIGGCYKKAPNQDAGAGSSEPSKVVILDDNNFDSNIAQGLVLVDFWATWCGPCKIQGPIVEKVAQQVQDTAVIAKLDTDVSPKTARKFNISAIPTIIIFKDGKEIDRFVGVTNADKLLAALKTSQ